MKVMWKSLKQDASKVPEWKPRLMGHSGKSLEDPDANRNADRKDLVEKVSGGY